MHNRGVEEEGDFVMCVFVCVMGVCMGVWSCQTGHLSSPRCSFSVSFHPALSSTAPTWRSKPPAVCVCVYVCVYMCVYAPVFEFA